MSNPPSGFGRGGRGAALAQLLNQQVRRPGDQSEERPQQPTAFGGAQPQQSTAVFGAGQTQQFTSTSVAAPKQTSGESSAIGIQQQPVPQVSHGQTLHGVNGSSTQRGLLSSANIPLSSPVPASHAPVTASKPVELQPVRCFIMFHYRHLNRSMKEGTSLRKGLESRHCISWLTMKSMGTCLRKASAASQVEF
jgi:hypothetical protein